MTVIGTQSKRIFKRTVPLLPGYHLVCQLLRKHRPRNWGWVHRIPIKPGFVVLVHSIVGDLYMCRPERCSIAKKYFWTGGVRDPVEDRIALNLFSILCRSSEVVLDIGANSGLFSLVAAKANPRAKIVAFDILPEAYHVLIDNLILNNLLELVDAKLVGVGIEGGLFHAPFNNVSSDMPSSLSLDSGATSAELVPVLIRSLDGICLPRYLGKKMLVKIDVEGTEIDIFENGKQTLSLIRPDFICEVLPSARRFDDYDAIFDQFSYFKYLITDQGLRKHDKITPDLRFKDWLFTTRTDLDPEIKEAMS